MMMMFALLADLIGNIQNRNVYYKVFSFIIVLIILTFIPLTGERNAFLVTLLGCMLMFILLKKARRSLIVIFMCVIILISALFIANPSLGKRQTTSIEEVANSILLTSKDTPYSFIFNTSIKIFNDHILFDTGLKKFNTHCTKVNKIISDDQKRLTHPHNFYLEWLTGTGIIGSSMFFAIIFLWFKQFYQCRKLIFTSTIATGVLIAIIIRLWPLASTTSFFSRGEEFLFGGWEVGFLLI